ncbi:bifunctional oligoribonuclease/PAP phosphatase NrnA [Faecalibacillus faecis]|uniref:DHH family phosphoesterase n=1 Tax=Faecalibacillus faecis TaxID=1982628 RepID=UPI002585D2A5|nr:bifunctional oligoribonuclease/PAP phosphatase NrnA [uncultured Faecalibacillus sp.]
MIEEILNKIEEYDCICLYRHVNPDYDAFGSQFGMYDLIKNTFSNKTVYMEGDFSSDLVQKFNIEMNIEKPKFEQPVLGIVLDTANKERIDGESYQQCKEIIKIDHHIVVESYGNINLEDSSASSCSQMVALFLKNERVHLTSFGAASLYMGIMGDTNRFMYSGTDCRTFEAAMYLYNCGFDMQALYERMYMKKARDLKVNAYLLNHYIEDEGIAYYILKDEDLKALDLSRERGSDYVNILSSVEEYKIWLAITENVKDHNWRVSMRSRHYPVNAVANKYRGGGHAFASGATLLSIDELPSLIKDLKELINE